MMPTFAMQSMVSQTRRGDGHLWMIALGFSLLANAGFVGLLGLSVLKTTVFNRVRPVTPPPTETYAMIYPDLIQKNEKGENRVVVAESPPLVEKRFVRTSADQTAPPEEKSSLFIGERNTRATSERAPSADAAPLPSQAGIEANEGEIETTQSSYQDGVLAAAATMPSAVDSPQDTSAENSNDSIEAKPSTEKPENPGTDSESALPPPREKLLTGPNPVDVLVSQETSTDKSLKPTAEKRAKDETPPLTTTPTNEADAADAPKPKPPTPDPMFKGFQRKTAVVGSISRTGRSALDVEDSPLGRYQATISRAVELEFQRNCVRHRDYITPGFITIRFFVEANGKVRSVQFTGEMTSGEIQKGFTLNSIRDAEIPPMPAAMRREFSKEPLELIFRFYF